MKIPCFLVPLKKKDGVASPVYVISVCHLLSFLLLLYPLVHTILEIFYWYVAQPSAGWLLCRKELHGQGLHCRPQNPVDLLPPHTPLSSFSMSSLTSWTNAIQRKETQEASFPRSCSSWKYCFCAWWTVQWDFHLELKPWQYLPASHTTAEGSWCSARRPRNVVISVFNFPSLPPSPSVGSFELLLLLFSPFCHFSFHT